MKLKTFDHAPTGKEFAKAWGDAFEAAVRSLETKNGNVTKNAAAKLAQQADASHVFADNILHFLELDGKKIIKADDLIQAGYKYVSSQVHNVTGGDPSKKLTLWDVRKFNDDLVEDGYALRGKDVPEKLASKLALGVAEGPVDFLTGKATAQAEPAKTAPQKPKAPAKKAKAPTATKKTAPAATKKNAAATKKNAAAKKKKAPTPQKIKAPTAKKKNASAAATKNSPAAKKKNSPAAKKKNAPAAKPKNAPAAKKPAKTKSIAQLQATLDTSVTEVFTTPDSRSSTTVRFKLPEYGGREIHPGERWLFEVPEDLRKSSMKIRTVILAHRKDSKYADSYEGEHDTEGAYNLVSARVAGTDQWVTWSDEYGDEKFAEKRSSGDPEHENLHDWIDAVGFQSIDLLSVKNVGEGDRAVANVHLLEMEFLPTGSAQSFQEEIFTPGTRFINLEDDITMPIYGGGKHYNLSQEVLDTKGLYPDALVLGGYGYGAKDKGKDCYVQSGNLHIRLPAGKKLGALEVAIGDTAWKKGVSAEDQTYKGHVGKRGWAKLYANIKNTKTHESGQDFMVNVNVPPAGVLSGSPNEMGYVTKPGDEIVVRSQGHESWVMGYRVQFLDDD